MNNINPAFGTYKDHIISNAICLYGNDRTYQIVLCTEAMHAIYRAYLIAYNKPASLDSYMPEGTIVRCFETILAKRNYGDPPAEPSTELDALKGLHIEMMEDAMKVMSALIDKKDVGDKIHGRELEKARAPSAVPDPA